MQTGKHIAPRRVVHATRSNRSDAITTRASADALPTPGRAAPGRAPLAAVAAFGAGAVAVLTAHQAALWALHRAGWSPWPGYSLAPTRPLGVPQVASAAFWGGVWWVRLDRLVPRAGPAAAAYGRAALLGAVLPNAVGALLLALGRGQPLGGAPRGRALAAAVAVNALWAATAAALRRARPPGR